MNRVADRLRVLVSHGVAHRLDRPKPPGITGQEVKQLLSDLQEAYTRWSILLRATDVYAEPDRERLLDRVIQALEMFDFDAYLDALQQELARTDPLAGIGISDIEARLRVEYRFD